MPDGSPLYRELCRAKHSRDDGWLCELVSMRYDDDPFSCVHAYMVSVAPGRSRANHYHKKKEEWFAVVSGRIEVLLSHVLHGDSASVVLDCADPVCRLLYIPPFVAHSIRNPESTASTLVVFSRSPEDREDTIPFDFDGERSPSR
jgi:oxalate decarboxylase/phosphoglucose isomerase-like protein (cupin superfamily)